MSEKQEVKPKAEEQKNSGPLKVDKYADAKSELDEMKKWADAQDQKKDEKKSESKTKQKTESKETEKTISSSQLKTSIQKSTEKKPEPKKAEQKKTSEPVKKQAEQKTSAKKPAQKAASKTKASKQKGKKKHNYLLWTAIIVVAVPCLILLWILLDSRESSGTPVEGSRFDHSLDPAITEADVAALKDALVFDQAESVEINLKSATLRITINTKDDLSQEDIQNVMASAYDKVVEKLPVDTYFTNKKDGDTIKKMYDLEVTAYNYIPEKEEDKDGQIHLSRTKNAAAEKVVDDVLTSPKDEESADKILNPDTSNPPKTEGENKEGA